MKKIKSVKITAMPKTVLDPIPKVIATFEDDSVKELFSFYPDEISFTPEEFIGLTEAEAVSLKNKKDQDYLRS
jgi:hypothetical protein